MAPDNTLFPGMDGTPGDIPESTDITGQVLPPLSDGPTEYPLSDASQNVHVLSDVPQYDVPGQENTPDNDVAVVDGTPRQPAPPTRRSLDDRIDSLIGGSPRGERTYGEEQLAQLTDALLKQGHQIESLINERRTPTTPPAAPAPNQEVDPLTGQAAPPAPAPGLTANDVESIMEKTIQNYDARLTQQRREADQLQLSQEDSYSRAMADVPGINDPANPVHQTFLKVWQRSPLHNLPDGPYQVALQVQGLLATDAASNANLTNRKRQAAPGSPAPTATDELGTAQVQALQKEYARISQAIKAGSKDRDLLFKFRKIGRALGRTRMSGRR